MTTFSDSFSDGSLGNWVEEYGSWSDTGSVLKNTSSDNADACSHTSDTVYGTWEFDHDHGPIYYGANTYVIANNWTSGNHHPDTGYSIRHKNTNNNYARYFKRKDSDGTLTTLADLGNFDGSKISYRVERETDDTWSIYVAGSLQATVTDGTHTTSNLFVCRGGNSGHRWDNVSVQESKPPATPSNVTATADANDQITVSWTDNSSNEDNFRVQVSRDGTSYVDLANNPTPGANTTSITATPESDNSYDSQVGIDSSFKFRVRAENSSGSSDWAYSGTVYTDPVPPHDPTVSRPDGSTIDITATQQSDMANRIVVYYREDTGSGYNSWGWFDTIHSGEESSGDVTTKGSRVTKRYDVGMAYQNGTLQEDARYQFRLKAKAPDGSVSANYVYADYGNDGNVVFEDGFESGGLGKWDTTALVDADSGVRQSPSSEASTDTNVSGPEESSYLLELQAGDYVVKEGFEDLGYKSGPYYVKAALAAGSMDSSSEQVGIEWYDPNRGVWQNVRKLSWEFNKQGWVEVSGSIPDNGAIDLGNFKLRLRSYGGSGDYLLVDHVVVSDVVHEYTAPLAPTDVTYDASVENEITSNYTRNATFGHTELKWDQVNESDGESGYNEKRVSGGQGTITGLLDGELYDVFTRATIDQYRHGSLSTYHTSDAGQTQLTTVLPAPTSLSIDAKNGDQFDLSWTDNADNEDGHRIYWSRDGGSTWTQDGSVGAGVTSYTTSHLLDGEQYDLQVRVHTEHAESASSTVTDTTDLPDVTDLAIDTSTEDELTASWTDTIDYGDYHVEYRESSASSWTDWDTASQGTSSTTITGLEDGEEYDVRVRSQTEHVTGAWASETATTLLPVVTNLSTGTPTKTEVRLSWTDNADNEDGYRVLRARKYDDGWGPWQTVAEPGSDATSYTDSTLSPGNTYKYKIESFTEDSTADSTETGSVTTDSSGKPRTQTGSDDWEVRVEHQSGRSVRPQILDDPTFLPTLNDYPRVEIPVPRDEKWQASGFEEAPLSVWKDGRILPIDTLVNVRVEDDRAVLEGRGGAELAQRVQVEYDDMEAHLAAESIIQETTSYSANVDDPASGTESDTLMQEGDTETELRNHLDSAIPADEPAVVEAGPNDSGRLRLLDSCFLGNYGDIDRDFDLTNYYTGDYNATSDWDNDYAEVVEMNSEGSYVEFSFTPEYTIPAENANVIWRIGNPNGMDDGHELDIYLNDELVGGYSAGFSMGNNWDWYSNDIYSSDLPGGTTHTVRIEIPHNGLATDNWYVDLMGVADSRYNYSYPNTVDSDYALSGPETKPDSHTVVFEDATTAFNVVGGQIDLTIDDTSNKQAVALSNDQGASWTEGTNTTSLQTDFGSAGSTIRFRVTLSRYGSRTGVTPTEGIQSQKLDAYSLYADLEDTPVLDEQTYDGALVDVLDRIADYGNFIWELRRDQQNGWTVEWTQPGERTADSDNGVADYSVSKSVEKAYDKVVVKGSGKPVRGEPFTANVGGWVPLNNENLVTATESVWNPNDGETYKRGADYELNRSAGEIKPLSDGAMSDGSAYKIGYWYKTQGSCTSEDAGSDPDTLVKSIPSITSDLGCEQAALYLLEQVRDPVWYATVTIPKADAGLSLVDDLLVEDLPTDGERMEIRELRQTPQKVTLELGSRESIGTIVQDLERRVNSVAERV